MTVDITEVYKVYTVTRSEAGEVYPITFPYISPEYVKCYYVVDKEQTQLVFGRDYTVDAQANELTITAALPVGAQVVVYRVTDLTQEIDWVDGQSVYTPDIEQADDKAMHILQELAEQTNRSVKITREEEAAGINPEYRWEEIEAARNEVLQAKADTEQARDESVEAKDIAVEAKDIVLEKEETVLGIIDEAKTIAVSEIETSQADALTAIDTDKTGALEALETDKQRALSAIAGSKQDALSGIADSIVDAEQTISNATATATSDIASAESGALDTISTATQDSVASVTQAKDDAIADVNMSGVEWVQKAKNEADRSGSEADRAKSEADRAQQIVDLGPATTTHLGVVKVGEGLSIATDGTLSAKAQEINIGPDMIKDASNTISDKREVLYFDFMPEGGLPTDNVKDGAVAIIDDDDDVATLDAIAGKVADILQDSFPSGGVSGGTGELPELTDEHVVAYLNGKPVYEKLFQLTLGNSANVTNTIGTMPDDFQFLIGLDAIVTTDFQGSQLPVVFVVTNNSGGVSGVISFNITGLSINERHTNSAHNGRTVFATIRYTKTTD